MKNKNVKEYRDIICHHCINCEECPLFTEACEHLNNKKSITFKIIKEQINKIIFKNMRKRYCASHVCKYCVNEIDCIFTYPEFYKYLKYIYRNLREREFLIGNENGNLL